MTQSNTKQRFDVDLTEDEVVYLKRETQLFNPRLDVEELHCCLNVLLKHMMNATMMGVTERQRKLLKDALFMQRQSILDSKLTAEEIIVEYFQACLHSYENIVGNIKHKRNLKEIRKPFETMIEPIDYFTYGANVSKLKRRLVRADDVCCVADTTSNEFFGEKRIRSLFDGPTTPFVDEPDVFRDRRMRARNGRTEVPPPALFSDDEPRYHQQHMPKRRFCPMSDHEHLDVMGSIQNRNSLLSPFNKRNSCNSSSSTLAHPFRHNESSVISRTRLHSRTRGDGSFADGYLVSRDGRLISKSAFGAFAAKSSVEDMSSTKRKLNKDELIFDSFREHSNRYSFDPSAFSSHKRN